MDVSLACRLTDILAPMSGAFFVSLAINPEQLEKSRPVLIQEPALFWL
ncbi:hypothetical protein HMPREF0880_02097 [Yokenella regensburgei ATCC 43003]|nr:hypothetical protein HMPREF0880_02097 [Yokenella regensburgei ATCC 43003]